MSNAQVQGEGMSEDGFLGTKGARQIALSMKIRSIVTLEGARLWLLTGFILGFGALIAAIWILFQEYVATSNYGAWPGVALVAQNVLIFLAYAFKTTVLQKILCIADRSHINLAAVRSNGAFDVRRALSDAITTIIPYCTLSLA